MIHLSVFCPRCGRRLGRAVDTECPPSHLRCRCGMAFNLTIEGEPLRTDYDQVFHDEDAAWDKAGVTSEADMMGSVT